jgi:hypothetical protein
MTAPTIVASLDLACFLQVVMARRSALTTTEREKARAYVIRGLAALVGNPLPAGEAIDSDTAMAAFDAVCAAIVDLGISNAELAAHFNQTAISRTH